MFGAAGNQSAPSHRLGTAVNFRHYSSLTIAVPIQRSWTHSFLSLLLPMFLVTLCSNMSFTMGEDDSNRLGFLATLLLTVLALKWSSAETLPKISYLCTLDILFLTSYVYLLICMLISAVRLEPNKPGTEGETRARRLNKWLAKDWQLLWWLNCATVAWLLLVGVLTWYFRRNTQLQLQRIHQHALKHAFD